MQPKKFHFQMLAQGSSGVDDRCLEGAGAENDDEE